MGKDESSRVAWLIGALLAVLQAVVIMERTTGQWFTPDDLMNLETYRMYGLCWAYFSRTVGGQYVPGFRLFYAAYWEVFGLQFWGFQAYLVTVSLLGIVGLVVLGKRVKASNTSIGCFGLVYAFLLQHQHCYLWMAAAVHTMGPLCATIWMFVIALGRGKARNAWCALLYACCVCFTPKAIFSIIFLVGLLASNSRQSRPMAGLVKAAKSALWFIPIVVLYGALALASSRATRHPAPLGTQLKWAYGSLLDSTIAGTFGLGTYGPYGFEVATAILAWFIVSALVIWSIKRSSGASDVWLSLLAYLVVVVVMMARQRAGQASRVIQEANIPGFGGTFGRYNVENATFFIIAMMVTYPRVATSFKSRFFTLAASLLVVAGLNHQSDRVYHSWATPGESRAYVQNALVNGFSGARHVPHNVVFSYYKPYNDVANFAMLLEKGKL